MRDWLDALDGFDAFQIDMACRGYLKDEPSRRPTPAAIRKRAMDIRGEQMARERAALPPPPPEPPLYRTDAEVAERKAMAERIIAEVFGKDSPFTAKSTPAVKPDAAPAFRYAGAKPSPELIDSPLAQAARASAARMAAEKAPQSHGEAPYSPEAGF
jgi:hypothetical protein